MFDKVVTKKNALIVVGFLTLLLIVVDRIGRVRLCGGNFFHGVCADTYLSFIDTAIFIIPTFILCLIAYKMRDEIFRSWAKFASWSVPLSIIAISLSATHSNSYVFSSDRELLTMLLVPLFVLISLAIIVWKWYKLRNK